jgi:hypothetical protein
MRTAEERAHDVMRLVEAARRLAEDAAIAHELTRSTGLSPEGVERALSRHLETRPSRAEIDALVRYAGNAERVLVVLSANVFVAALRAIAIGRAASDHVVVRPSRREPIFARALIEAASDPAIALEPHIGVETIDSGEIHVYGRDETVAFTRAHARPGVRVRGHGAGMGVAWISRSAALDHSARRLADDVIAFDQRGCLSPRIALVEGDYERGVAFAHCMHAALSDVAQMVPRGVLTEAERAEAVRWSDALSFATGALHAGDFGTVGIAPSGAPLLVPPPGRHLHIAPAPNIEAARAMLAPMDGAIVTVGSDDPGRAELFAPPHARIAELGAMQRPPFDGPVDRRDP